MKSTAITNWDELPIMLTPIEAAKIFRFDPCYVRKMCKDGELPNFRQGTRIRISKTAVRKYIENLGK